MLSSEDLDMWKKVYHTIPFDSFVVLGIPLAKQSFRYTHAGIKYQPKEVTNWYSQARAQIINQLPEGFKPIEGAVMFHRISFEFPRPKTMPKKLSQINICYRHKKPDIDNACKSLFDCCKGVLFLDDAQIVRVNNVQKIYSDIPKVAFTIQKIENEASY